MITKDNLKDLVFLTSRPQAEPQAVQVDVWIGDLYLGQRTFYAQPSIAKAKKIAKRYIEQYGSLN